MIAKNFVATLRPITAALLLGLPSVVAAQNGPAGSQTGFFVARNLAVGGGASSTASTQLESEAGFGTAGPVAVSPQFQFFSGSLWTGPGLTATGPVVFGVDTGAGTKDGGTTHQVFGFNFTPGIGATTAALDGVAAPTANVVSNLVVSLETPPGTDLVGNPKARVGVELTNPAGSFLAPDAYAYFPALLTNERARTGATHRVHAVSEPGSFVALAMGLSFPGVTLPFAPFEGSFDLLTSVFFTLPAVFSPDGSFTYEFPLPDTPTIIGFPLEFQAVSIRSIAPLEGSFTNRLTTVVQS